MAEVTGFIESPPFPDSIAQGSSGGPQYSTTVLSTGSGFERRNVNWSTSRHSYDVAFGVTRSDQLQALIALFNVASGKAYGFRFKDWGDYKSGLVSQATTDTDQFIGMGNGVDTVYLLKKTYTHGQYSKVRSIRRPVVGTVSVAIGGFSKIGGWSLDYDTGLMTFDTPPGSAETPVIVTAGFEFDVPCRFDIDTLEVTLKHYQQGSASVPIVEIKEE